MAAARDEGTIIARGVALFNDARFWEAHEEWEQLWLTAEGEDRRFLQGLIQLAAAYVHVQKGTFRGGVRLFDAALARLGASGPRRFGVEVASAMATASVHRERIASGEAIDPREYPRLSYN